MTDSTKSSLAAEFEKKFADWVGCKNKGISFLDFQASLRFAFSVLEIKNGDEIILSNFADPELLNTIKYFGAKPVICDVSDGWTIDPKTAEELITSKTKAIVTSNSFGIHCNTFDFRKFNLPLIEDSSQFIGDTLIDKAEGDITFFSFSSENCFNCDGGSIIIFQNDSLFKQASGLIDKEKNLMPLDEEQAAAALHQLINHESNLKKMKSIAGIYLTELAEVNPKTVNYEAKARSIFYKFLLTVDGGIEKYQPIFLQYGIRIERGIDHLLHRIEKMDDSSFSKSIELFNNTISIPLNALQSIEEVSTYTRHLRILR